MDNLPKVSVVIPTRDRPRELAELLSTIVNQNYFPSEVIIVDDSPVRSAKQVVDSFSSKFKLIHCKLKYIEGSSEGLPAARSLAISISRGDIILFLDDDTLLDQNVVKTLAIFMKDNPSAMGVQPWISSWSINPTDNFQKKFEDATYKALMLSFHEKNRLAVRRSGQSVFPSELTKIICAQRSSGCCCWKREVFDQLSFDTRLKRWGFMEDLDFSYRVYKQNPQSLFVTPKATVIHKRSKNARLATKIIIYMSTVYWFYVFFKNVFEASIVNLIAFLWALTGNLVTSVSGLIIKKKSKREWWAFIYLLESYAFSLKNLKQIIARKLDFFHKYLDN